MGSSHSKPSKPHRHPSRVEPRLVADLKAFPTNARTHSKRQIQLIAKSIEAFGFTNPLLIDEEGTILAGHGRLQAARFLGLAEVPTLRVDGMSEAEKRAYVIADNRLAEKAGWDIELLSGELGILSDLLVAVDLDFAVTGFEPEEVDALLRDAAADTADLAEDPELLVPAKAVISQPGDLWLLGKHRLCCGDAREQSSFERLLGHEKAQMVFVDPPYNVRINGHVGGRGNVRHREFAMASGEMTEAEFEAFLAVTLGHCAAASQDGSIHYVAMDWRHAAELLSAGRRVYDELKNLCVWVKTNAGQGSFYRSQHEFVFVFKRGTAPHLNNFGLGKGGRHRSNVWNYAGVNSFRAGRMDELSLHPTVKPLALVIDALRDCSTRGGLVLDAFGGSGTTLIAAERVGRRAALLELDPAYCDVTIRRWQAATGTDAVRVESGETFDEAVTAIAAAGDGAQGDHSAECPADCNPQHDETAEAWLTLMRERR